MKSIVLLSIEENSLVKHHQFNQHDDGVYSLLLKLSIGRIEFSIEVKDTESIATFGFDANADLVLNQLVQLQKDGPDVGLKVTESGIYCFSLNMSEASKPMLRVQADHLEAFAARISVPADSGLAHFLNSKLPVTLEVGSTEMSIDSVMSLVTGSIIELDRQVGESLDVYVGEALVAKGEVVMMPDNTFGARIVQLMPVVEELGRTFSQESGAE
ncbi:FliM/FliN family flagellar motor switch protein [bacterium]|nr:FliM/FliN family flagellar motor switch protein [bacterium]